MSFDVVQFSFSQGVLHFLAVFGGVLVITLVISLLISVLKFGFVTGIKQLIRAISGAIGDFIHTSPKRVWAITLLTWRESVRKKALFVFVIFALLIMFAGWFLRGSGDREDLQVKNYITFMMTAITWLTLPVLLLLSCWGLPTDIKNRSLHTVVTKPIRRQEVVLGRFFGFSLVGTIVLLMMGTVGYFWIMGQVPEKAKEELIARVPVYCNDMYFTNKMGNRADRGINVGDLWDFRSSIEGGTKARVFYEFDNLDVEAIRKAGQMRLEYNFEAFRSHKGDIDKRLLCQLTIENKETGLRVPLPIFEVQEFSNRVSEKTILLNETVSYVEEETSANKQASLVNDILQGGSITVEGKCLDPKQYLGMARPDLFIKMPDRAFASTYFKGIFGIWLQMVLIIVLGVTVSCFVKGPVATLLTFGVVMVGASGLGELMRELVKGTSEGGGPFESAYRMYMHMNQSSDLDAGLLGVVMEKIDYVMVGFLWTVQHLIPRFDYFNMSAYVANGVDVPWGASLMPSLLVTLAFVIPCLILGYFSLQLREMEAK